MVSRLRISALMLVSVPICSAATFDPDGLLRFHKQYNFFIRKYLGCPPGAITSDQCFPGRVILDLKLWQEVVERAKVVR